MLRELLLYLWRHRESPPSEYAIGVDVLGRKPDFDPRTDATVRVNISRLRQKLRDYYDAEAPGSAERLEVPSGAYGLELVSAPLPAGPPPRRPYGWMAATGVLLACCLLLAVDAWRLRRQITNPVLPVPPLWAPLPANVNIVVPAPLFFRWEPSPYVVRDFSVNRFEQRDQSPLLRQLTQQYGPPETTSLYTVASDTLAAAQVARFLTDRGGKAAILDRPGVPADLIASQETVILAGPGSFDQVLELAPSLGFHLKSGTGAVWNVRPAPGEPDRWMRVRENQIRQTSFGILARIPSRPGGQRLFVLASDFNIAVATAATSATTLAQLQGALDRLGSPPWFEAVFRFERHADRVVRMELVATRAVKP